MPRVLYLVFWLAAAPLAAAVPAGFTDSLVASVGGPTALAFTPDGRLLITTQGGDLRVYKNGSLLATPALDLTAVCTNSERGLLGVAVDPDFATNRYVYLFYTYDVPSPGGCVNRVSRFTFGAGDTINPATEMVLVDNMPSPAGNHNAGDVHFGRDGFLYISIGDGGCDHASDSGCAGQNDAARDQHVLTGKILRITKTGGIPAGNPFQGAGTARCNATGQTTAGNKCQETFAWGLRNPFRIAFDPNSAGTRFFINDVGQGLWEEIDEGAAGADYGWNLCEGAHNNNSDAACSNAPPGHVGPIYDYRHGQVIPGTTSPTNCNSITGGAFVPDGLWPGFDGAYLFGDFVCGEIFSLRFSGGSWSASDFGQGLGGVATMIFGPHGGGQALYYTTFANGGEVRKIFHTSGPLDLHTAAPCRLVDTRSSGPALAAGSTRSFMGTGVCGIPAAARALTANVTAINPSSAGYLQIFPGGTAAASTSVLNFAAGQTRANNALIQLGTGGSFLVFAGFPGGTAHLIVDVVGWFE